MKRVAYAAALFACIILTGYVLFGEEKSSPRRPGKPETPGSLWSKPAGGFAGRLVVSKHRIEKGEHFKVALELKNVSGAAGALGFQTMNYSAFSFEVLDANGNVVEAEHVGADHVPQPRWGIIPAGAYAGFAVSHREGIFDAELETIGTIWKLAPGKYKLKGTYTSDKFTLLADCKDSKNIWKGNIVTPAVEIEIKSPEDK